MAVRVSLVTMMIFIILILVGSIVLSSMAADAARKGNGEECTNTAYSYSVWNAVLSALIAALVAITLILYMVFAYKSTKK